MPQNIHLGTDKKDILFITHELSLTGAPIVMMDAVKAAKLRGEFIVVLAFQDGPLRKKLLDMGIPVIIDPVAYTGHWMSCRFARNFDIVFANTVAAHSMVEKLSDAPPRIYWWLHDGEYALRDIKHLMPKQLGTNTKVLCVSEYTKSVLHENGFPYNSEILHFGVDDQAQQPINKPTDKTHFLFAGSFEERKGVDILLEAIAALSPAEMSMCEFHLIGAPMFPEIFKTAQEFASTRENVHVYSSMPRENVLEIMKDCTAIIVPSRDEPFSIVAVEGMMLNCVPICSDKVGFLSYTVPGETSFSFTNENSVELNECLRYVLNHPEEISKMQKACRSLYLSEFTLPSFTAQFNEVVL